MSRFLQAAWIGLFTMFAVLRAQPAEHYFAQVAVGGGAETWITVHNPGSATIMVTSELIGSDGVQFEVDAFAVDPQSTLIRSYGGNDGLPRAGWARLQSDGAFQSTLFYRIPGVGNVGVSPSLPALGMTLFHVVEGGANTGLALANPSPTESAEISFTFRNAQGGVASERESVLMLPPRSHSAFFLSEAPYSVLVNGSSEIRSTQPVIAVSLRLDGNLLSGVPVLLDAPYRWEDHPISPNIIAGSPANGVAPGVHGGTVSGGGAENDPSVPVQPPKNLVEGNYGTIGGGVGNLVGSADGNYSTIAGGVANKAAGDTATVAGGARNSAEGGAATIGGGVFNTATGRYSTLGGGHFNRTTGWKGTVGGGEDNWASAESSFVGGGEQNKASETFSSVTGGYGNDAKGYASTVAGGAGNLAEGAFSLAAGRIAWALHDFTFVWAGGDDDLPAFESTASNQFLIRAPGGVGIGTNAPGAALHVKSGFSQSLRLENAAGNQWFLTTWTTGNQFSIGRVGVSDDLLINKDGNVGIGTTAPQGRLDVNGPIYQRGGSLHADYVFEPGYQLESIEDHSRRMWAEKHLPALKAGEKDDQGRDVIEFGARLRGVLEELEKAHVYIEQLHLRMLRQEAEIERLKQHLAGDRSIEMNQASPPPR